MTEIPFIPPLKINLKIRNRCNREGFNHRYQFENPVGDKFEFPEGCRKHQDKRKYQCESLTTEDVLEFRAQLYRTTEKSDQNEFISKYLNVSTPKRRYGKLTVARVMTVVYKIPKIGNTEEYCVCRSMFFAVTGMLEKRIKGVTEKLFKKYLMEHGESGMFDTGRKRESLEKKEKFKQLLSDKTERILSLEKGTFEVFSKVVIGNTGKEFSEHAATSSHKRHKLKGTDEKHRKIRHNKKIKSDDDFVDFDDNQLCNLLDSNNENWLERRNLLDLDTMEICRICLQNDGRLKSILNKGKSKSKNISEMIHSCFSVRVERNDGMPQKICQKCYENLKVSYNLRKVFLESQEIMKTCMEETEDCILEKDEPSNNEDYEMKTKNELNYVFSGDSADEENVSKSVNENSEFSSSKNTVSTINSTSTKPTKCFLCDVDFDTTPEDHFKDKHNQIKMEKCTKCEFETEFPWYLNLHYQIHADDKRLCTLCGKVYQKGSSHPQHCRQKNSERVRLFCRFCKAGYWNPHTLKEHERIHTHEKPYQCTQCCSAFYRKIHLRKHMLDHGVEPNFRCRNCKKPFLVKNRLLSHESTCCRGFRPMDLSNEGYLPDF